MDPLTVIQMAKIRQQEMLQAANQPGMSATGHLLNQIWSRAKVSLTQARRAANGRQEQPFLRQRRVSK